MKGAAAATVIGQGVSTLMVIIYCLNFKTVPLKKEHLIPSLSIVQRIASIGMASCFNQLAIAVVQIVLNNSLRHYGALSQYGPDEPIACAGIIMKVNMIVFSIVIGLAQGTQPIESFNYGAKNFNRVKKAYRLAVVAGAIVSIAAFALFQLIPRQILSLFGEGSETYFEFGVKFFRVFLFFTWINCLQPITSTFFTSIGKPIKGVSAEAIKKSGYDVAVNETDAKLLSLVQQKVRTDLFGFLNGTITGATSVTGVGLQAALANAWGQLQVLFEDDTAQAVYFVNPLDVADYLGKANITVQTAFGMNYVEDFLGLGTVITSNRITQGTFLATAKENIIMYYLTMNGDVADAFKLTADELGYIGIASGIQNTERAQIESLVMSGIQFLVEYASGVVKGTITTGE